MFSMNIADLIPIPTLYLFAAVFILLTIALFFTAKRIFKCKRLKTMGIWFLAWLLAGAVLLSAGVFGQFVDPNTIDTKYYTKAELTQDLKQVETLIMGQNPLYFADADELKLGFQSAYAQINDRMTEVEFYRLINPLIVDINCGHTILSISEALEKNREKTARFFPLKVTLVGNQLYILEDDPLNDVAAGAEIKSINGKSSAEIIQKLLDNISRDGGNEAKSRYIISRHFNSRFFDYVDNSDRFQVELWNKEGGLKIVDLEAKPRPEFNITAWTLHFSDRHYNKYYESKIYQDYAVLTIHSFTEDTNNKFETFLEEFFAGLTEQNIPNLIIDLRGNYGGDPAMAKALLSHLVKKEINYFNGEFPFLYNLMGYDKPVLPKGTSFNGKVVFLTDGACFSTTGHFCALAKYHGLGTFVGSETGGTYVCTDGAKDAVLNNSRLRLHYSTFIFKVAANGLSDTKGVAPDMSISPSIEDLLNERDIQMEKGLQALGL